MSIAPKDLNLDGLQLNFLPAPRNVKILPLLQLQSAADLLRNYHLVSRTNFHEICKLTRIGRRKASSSQYEIALSRPAINGFLSQNKHAKSVIGPFHAILPQLLPDKKTMMDW
jgi:hypothetical protein